MNITLCTDWIENINHKSKIRICYEIRLQDLRASVKYTLNGQFHEPMKSNRNCRQYHV